jgi:D-serine deaminase-like pyridoxal phosphate-dependent protein
MNMPLEVTDQLPTPCLVVDAMAARRNIEVAAAYFRTSPVKLRPHFKAHKCTRLLREQLNAGGCVGVTCQTSWEAVLLSTEGFEDILIANEVVDVNALEEVACAARRSKVTVAVDDLAHVELLGKVCAKHHVQLGVLIELDVGIGRCGLPADSAALVPLAQGIVKMVGLEFRGLQVSSHDGLAGSGASSLRTRPARVRRHPVRGRIGWRDGDVGPGGRSRSSYRGTGRVVRPHGCEIRSARSSV